MKKKIHKFKRAPSVFDSLTLCGSLKEDLSLAVTWDLVTCGHCLRKKYAKT